MTVDLKQEQFHGATAGESEQTMATSTMTTANAFAKSSNMPGSVPSDPTELSSKLSKLQVRDRQSKMISGDLSESNIPKRQPTIVCEDIADDIDIEEETESIYTEEQTQTGLGFIDQSGDPIHEPLSRSASTASLSVPQQSIEIDDEKKRPPLTCNHHSLDEQMMIEPGEAEESLT